MKTRPDDVLSHLPAPQQATLRDWLKEHSYEKVRQLASQPPPAGLGIDTSVTALHRYNQKNFAEEVIDQLKQFTAELANLGADPDAALALLLQRAALRNAALGELSPGEFNVLSRHQHRRREDHHKTQNHQLSLEHQNLRKDRLTLQTRAFEFSAARKALEHAHKLLEILADQKLDDQDKITHAHQLIFKKAAQ